MNALSRMNPTARGLSVLYSSTLLSGLGWAMILPAIPVLASEFDVSLGFAAQTVTAFALGRFGGTPVAGIVVDRFGSRAGMIGGPALVGLAALGAVATPWFAILLVMQFVIGFGDVVWTMAREVAGIDLVRTNQRGRVLSGFHGMHTGGLAVGPLLGGVLTVAFSFRAVFVAFAILAIAGVLLGTVAHRAKPSAGGARAQASQTLSRFSLAIKARLRALADLFKQIEPRFRPSYWAFVFATFAGFMFRLTVQNMLPLYAHWKLGLSPVEVGVLFSISGGVVFAMILPAGFVIDKIGRKWATVPSTLLPGVAFVLIPFADTFLQLAILVSILGVSNGLSLGSLATSTYDVVPEEARGRLQAARRTIAEVGGVGGPLLGGFLANAMNPGVPFLAYAPILIAAGLLLAFVARETLVKNPVPEASGASSI